MNSSPPTGCKNGCQYPPTTSKTTSCYRYPGSDNQGFCNYVLMTDGSARAADSGNPGMTGPSLNDTADHPDEPLPTRMTLAVLPAIAGPGRLA
ncbi:hypothetical protein P4050_00655 [Pseudomonas aeruginosa]|nr:hypothetical protein [Pseudomonas aeruginosa]